MTASPGGARMPNIRPVSDLRNYSEVLNSCQIVDENVVIGFAADFPTYFY
jgi:hypothetical protein